jgi:hypothetical protein
MSKKAELRENNSKLTKRSPRKSEKPQKQTFTMRSKKIVSGKLNNQKTLEFGKIKLFLLLFLLSKIQTAPPLFTADFAETLTLIEGQTITDIQIRDYHADFYFLTQGSTQIFNKAYYSDREILSSYLPFTPLPNEALNYSSSPNQSQIIEPDGICLVDKNKLLVQGRTQNSEWALELHELENN